MRSVTAVLIIIFILLIPSGCNLKREEADRTGIDVVVSIGPLAEMTERIGGDKIRVSVMVPPGASPHTYEPIPSQLVYVSNADVYVKMGTPIEFELVWLDKILSTNKDMYVIDASQGISPVEMDNETEDTLGEDHHHTGQDPHLWVSIRYAKLMVENIYRGLAAQYPEGKPLFEANKVKYLSELDDLDRSIEAELAGKRNRKFLVYHPAWTHLAKDYNLEQIPIEVQGKEPTARGIERVIRQAKESNIRVVFASPQTSSKSAEVIAREIGGHVVMIDPLSRDYVSTMRKVGKALADAME